MKTLKLTIYILPLLLFCSFSTLFGQHNKDILGIGSSIKFSSERYHLTRSHKPYNNYYIQEFIRPNENVNNFTKSVVVMAIIDTSSTDRLVGIKLAELKKMKEKNKTVYYQVLFNEGEGRIIEFSMSDGIYHFWNIQRYTVQTLKNGRQVGVMYTYIEKEKITDKWSIKDITENIKNKRISYITEVGEIEIPIVNPK